LKFLFFTQYFFLLLFSWLWHLFVCFYFYSFDTMTEQHLRRTRRAPRDAFTTKIFADLCEVTPEIVIPMPDPYNDNITLKQNIANLFYQLR
jgi:hypothetical protein